jgi:protein SCO1/2
VTFRAGIGRSAAACAAALFAALVFQGAAGAQVPDPRSKSAYPAREPVPGTSPDRLDQTRALRLSQSAIGNAMRAHVLRDADGAILRLSELRGKPLLVSFVYTGCFQVCPTTTRSLERAVEAAMRTLGPDAFNVISVGFNQPFDTPQAMRAFAQQQGLHLPNWHFASPDPDTLAALAADAGFSYAPVAGGFDHITQVTIVDAEGVVTAQVYGERFALPELVEPLKALLTGARPERAALADLAERVRLLCTYYDPVSGQYRFKYAILIEIAGGITGVLALLAFIARTLHVPGPRRPSARTP